VGGLLGGLAAGALGSPGYGAYPYPVVATPYPTPAPYPSYYPYSGYPYY
jgi:hypothetical protein